MRPLALGFGAPEGAAAAARRTALDVRRLARRNILQFGLLASLDESLRFGNQRPSIPCMVHAWRSVGNQLPGKDDVARRRLGSGFAEAVLSAVPATMALLALELAGLALRRRKRAAVYWR